MTRSTSTSCEFEPELDLPTEEEDVQLQFPHRFPTVFYERQTRHVRVVELREPDPKYL